LILVDRLNTKEMLQRRHINIQDTLLHHVQHRRIRARLVHAVTLPQLAAPEFRSCLVRAKPAPNLRHAATAQALSSSFWTPTHAVVQAADLIAAFLARPRPRRSMRRHRTKRALRDNRTPLLCLPLCTRVLGKDWDHLG
jgi:hypothetical protein